MLTYYTIHMSPVLSEFLPGAWTRVVMVLAMFLRNDSGSSTRRTDIMHTCTRHTQRGSYEYIYEYIYIYTLAKHTERGGEGERDK